ncbi:hypothetical protein [Candidatus Thiodictyon syntrophicum]|jgi:hypothetical protein|uniref:Uncharacterized protein n=1 Tax=Candidatus Thiodictyon syntrophicum TaxID=1166950 RepID=A0A2K8U4W2_9GAMM|nr:hypothetical protein [Candidatus Thiodictyon syntrophicum]AUB80575.1 hypothetical protein THSYN_06165 [Candidatus Thiodictyon syntrophicum]
MSSNICPVCEHEQDQDRADCARCGWDFSPLLGSTEEMRTELDRRLDAARTAWQEQRHWLLPERMAEQPRLQRDPFETPGEFSQRIGSRPWYVGSCKLDQGHYNVKTGKFPLEHLFQAGWASSLFRRGNYYLFTLARDQAKALYEESPTVPVLAWLEAPRGKVKLNRLVLLTNRGEHRLYGNVVRNILLPAEDHPFGTTLLFLAGFFFSAVLAGNAPESMRGLVLLGLLFVVVLPLSLYLARYID